MAKKAKGSLLEQLRATSKASRQHRSFILARREEISEAIQGGYTVYAIWEHLRNDGAIVCSYKTFLQNLKRFGVRPSPEPHLLRSLQPTRSQESSLSDSGDSPKVKQAPEKEPKKRFKFSPMPDPEDLV